MSYRIFYFILKKYSQLRIDPWAHHTRLISRRALNSLLRLRENSRYLKANYALVGYQTSFLATDVPLHPEEETSFGDQFRTALVAVTSFTTFLRSLLLWIFLFSVLVAGVAVFNAVKVKLTNVDIFGDHVETLSGWAFLVVLISVFFAITCLNLYIMSIYLSNIYSEIKNRPLYIIESVKRF
jgi:dolichol-phosphate mannosyltransferase